MHRNNKFPSKNNLERRSAHASRGSRVTSSFIHGAESSKHSNFRHSPSLPYQTNQFPTKLLLIILAIIACIIMITVALQNCSHAREYNWENLQDIPQEVFLQMKPFTPMPMVLKQQEFPLVFTSFHKQLTSRKPSKKPNMY